jgi:hypothetical protein
VGEGLGAALIGFIAMILVGIMIGVYRIAAVLEGVAGL